MSGWWLTRARLKRDAQLEALANLLLPADPHARTNHAHRLVWSLFGDGPDRKRDFLWREEESGPPGRASFLILSARQPADPHRLFDLDPPKPFAPALRPGDRLAFALRANPVVSRKDEQGKIHRHDVVMDALRHRPQAERKERRWNAMTEAGTAWLAAQGGRHGFALAGPPTIDGYDQRIIRRPGTRPARFSVLDLDGIIEVRESEAFLAAIRSGFGKAKAWGCGLMLIRRA